jgi:pimeloyl-ACP methyl ester carboxylesterase
VRAFLLVFWLLPLLGGAEAEEVMLTTDLGPLAATLEVPREGGMRAMVLIIAGSGPTDRDGNSLGLPGPSNSLRYLAEALLQDGIGSLRFDKRLIGGSATDRLTEAELRFDTYVADVRRWAEYLRGRFEEPIYVLGHSEGSLIGIMAAQSLDVDGVIGVAGPGRRAPELLLEQLRPQLPAPLLTEAERIVAELAAGRTAGEPPPVLAALFRRSVQPYLISWFAYDPAAELTRLEIPVLLVYGSTDIQAAPQEGEPLRRASPRANYVVIEGMNHVLKQVGPDRQAQIASYSDPTLPISEGLVREILAFLPP